jgi:P27 family predicted phage terminase small subunit
MPQLLTPPAWLPKESQNIFKTIVKLMADSDVLEPTDVYAVALLADSLHTYQESVKQIAAEGNTVVGDRGQTTRHPCHTIKSTTFSAINALFTQLGLSPSARKKLEIAASQVVHDDSHLAQFTK